MISIECRPHDRVELTNAEAGTFQDLLSLPWVQAGVARPAMTRVGVELRIGPYVGRIVVPDRIVIDVAEPYPGTVATCLDLSTSGRRAGEQASPLGRLAVAPWTAIAMRFEQALSDYVSKSIERVYVAETLTTSRPRGRIDIARTAALMLGHGVRDQVVCHPRLITDDTALNRAVFAAAVRAEQLMLRDGPDGPLVRIRSALMALSGVRKDAAPDFHAARRFLDPKRRDYQRLLSLAEVLVRGVPALPPSERQDEAYPMTAWINVQLLFEEAIRSVVRHVAATFATVGEGRGDGVMLFRPMLGDPITGPKSANPDVVVRRGKLTMLLDAKYRRHEEEFTDDELYQLMAHAGAYQATAAALVAPAGATQEVGPHWIGRDRTGVVYYTILVDPTSETGIYEPISTWLAGQLMLT